MNVMIAENGCALHACGHRLYLRARMELWKTRSAVMLELTLRCSNTATTLAAAEAMCCCTASPFLLMMLPTQSHACLSTSMLLPALMKGNTLEITAQEVPSSMSDRSYMMQASTRTLSIHSAVAVIGLVCWHERHKRRQKSMRLVESGRAIRLSS